MLRSILKKIALKIPFVYEKYKQKLIISGEIEKYDQHIKNIDVAAKVLLNEPLNKKIKVGLVKDMNFFADNSYVSTRSYYPKYERFLKNNNISYEYYDITHHDWIETAKKYDVVIWHTASDPCTQSVALNKIYILEKVLKIKCLPSLDEIWSYEDKINAHYMYKTYNLPEIPTFVTHSKDDVFNYVDNVSFPIISKLTTGSASYGVEKLENKDQAIKLINKIFSRQGIKTYFPFIRQKDYIYFQEFVDDATFDLRIITIGDKALGYYRYPNKGDFRASGAGNYEKKEIPKEALDLAFKVKEIFGSICLATDLLYSEKTKQYYIIESSVFIGVDTPRQLEINGVAGYYLRVNKDQYQFVEGEYWIQELTLKELLIKHF